MICKAKNPMVVPPGGFFFVTEIDRSIVKSFNLKELVRKVADFHRSKNVAVPDDLENDIVCQICYRNPGWCKQEQSEGMGDTVSKFTRRTGIAKMVAISQGGTHLIGTCSTCGKRKKRLNKKFPYRK